MHYAGVSCDMDRITAIAKKYKLYVVEDAAQGIGAYYKGRHLGTIGDIGAISFHETKNLTCGEGGVFLTNKKKIALSAEMIREKGTDRSRFLRGEVDKYTWRSVGSSFLLSDILSGVLLAQLHKITAINESRKKIYKIYMEEFKVLQNKGRITLPYIPTACKSNYHSFHILLPSRKQRDRCMAVLNEKGIKACFHYIPLHSSPFAKKNLGYKAKDLPITENLSGRLLRLPLYAGLKTVEIDYIVRNVRKVLKVL